MGAVERTTNVTANFRSTGAQDGWVLESTETSNTGGSLNSTGTTFNVGDDSQDRQYRGVLSFNTASLPDNAEVVWLTLKIRRNSTMGTDPFTTHGVFKVAIRGGYFHTQPALQLQDFQAAASNDWVGTIPNMPVSGWDTGNLISAAFPFINKNGITQFRLSFGKDDDDDHVADYLRFFSGNYTTTSLRPWLQVIYYVP
jgi:hypothetical protein